MKPSAPLPNAAQGLADTGPDAFDNTVAFDADELLAALSRPIVFVDLETTGSDPLKDRITEIGVVEAGPNGIDEWSVMLDPGQPIPPFIQQLTGISDEMVRGQPTFESLAPALLERLEGKLFIAHNARFDYGFLKNEFKRVGLRFRADVLCTVRLSRSLFPYVRKHGLDALIERFQLAPKGRHRALADADLLWQFWQKIHQRYSPELVDAAVRALIKRASLPATLDEDALEAIPALPGVYLFYGDNDQPIYVGKSIDLKQRVGAHFSGDHRDAKDMRLSREIRRVEVRVTAGEIGALLLEAQLVKTLAPTHNRMLRKRTAPCSWHFPEGAPAPRLTSPQERDFGRADGLFGVFDSKAKAESRLRKVADDTGLCLVALGLERVTPGRPCFGYQTQRCDGACIGEVSMTEHAARVREALAPLQIERWPYAGAIAFAERHRTGLTQWHVVDNWCYLGSSEDPRALHGLAGSSTMPLFDRDVYTILRRAFKEPKLDVLPLRVERTLQLEACASNAPSPHSSHGIGSRVGTDGAIATNASSLAASPASTISKPVARKAVSASQLAIDFKKIDA